VHGKNKAIATTKKSTPGGRADGSDLNKHPSPKQTREGERGNPSIATVARAVVGGWGKGDRSWPSPRPWYFLCKNILALVIYRLDLVGKGRSIAKIIKEAPRWRQAVVAGAWGKKGGGGHTTMIIKQKKAIAATLGKIKAIAATSTKTCAPQQR